MFKRFPTGLGLWEAMTHECSARWSVRECHDYFEQRPWEPVLRFYELLVNGEASLCDLRIDPVYRNSTSAKCHIIETKDVVVSDHSVTSRDNKGRGPRWERRTFKLTLCYSGTAFAGWQKQPGLLTVQSVLEKELGRFVDGKRARLLEEQGKIKEALVSVAGRTDKGVHASGQVCSFYTWMRDVKPQDVAAAVNSAMPTALRALSALEVDREFHPIFSAKWRRYVYILPLLDGGTERLDVTKVSKLLQSLEGLSLSYAIFARDTKLGRGSGPATVCTVYHARAAIAEFPFLKQGEETRTMVVELVADRFLRKMVRVLVSTAVREAAAGAPDDALLALMGESCRRVSAPPAPAQGLCLAEVGYADIQKASLLLS